MLMIIKQSDAHGNLNKASLCYRMEWNASNGTESKHTGLYTHKQLELFNILLLLISAQGSGSTKLDRGSNVVVGCIAVLVPEWNKPTINDSIIGCSLK